MRMPIKEKLKKTRIRDSFSGNLFMLSLLFSPNPLYQTYNKMLPNR